MKKRSTFSRILSFVLKYPFSTLGSLLCAVVTVVASLLVPVYFGDAIDYIVESGVDFVGLKAVLAKTAGAAAVAAISQWLMSLCNNRISCNVVRDLRAAAFDKLGNLPLSTFILLCLKDFTPDFSLFSRILAIDFLAVRPVKSPNTVGISNTNQNNIARTKHTPAIT